MENLNYALKMGGGGFGPFWHMLRPHVEGVRERVWAAHLEKEERECGLACASWREEGTCLDFAS